MKQSDYDKAYISKYLPAPKWAVVNTSPKIRDFEQELYIKSDTLFEGHEHKINPMQRDYLCGVLGFVFPNSIVVTEIGYFNSEMPKRVIKYVKFKASWYKSRSFHLDTTQCSKFFRCQVDIETKKEVARLKGKTKKLAKIKETLAKLLEEL